MMLCHSILRFVACTLIVSVFTSCALSTKRPSDPKTPVEQLLISGAIERSIATGDAGIPEGTRIQLDVSGLTIEQSLPGDLTQRHVRQVLAGWLGSQGLIVRDADETADLRVHIIIQSLGINEKIRFVGIPESKSVFLFVGVPEIALWKRSIRQGYVRFYLDIFEANTDRYIRSTKIFEGSVSQRSYIAMIVFRWQNTDLDAPLEMF